MKAGGAQDRLDAAGLKWHEAIDPALVARYLRTQVHGLARIFHAARQSAVGTTLWLIGEVFLGVKLLLRTRKHKGLFAALTL